MRPRQWIKNLLVVAVPLAAGQLLEPAVFVRTLMAFVAMCAASASVYLANDILDREADRNHPDKRNRPIASGRVSVGAATAVAVALAVAAVVGPALLGSTDLPLLILAYLVLQAVYITWAKHQPVLDLASVAAGFVLRAVAGGVASNISISTWFLTVTAASAMFVVAGKRYSELVTHGHESGTRQGLKEYSEGYLRFVWGVSVGIAVVFYGLWAAELGNGGSAMWARLSVIPFVLLLLRYARDIDAGAAEAPEDIVWGDRVLQALGVIWAAMFVLQVMS
ncbi:MAG: decaprenyl-phosphate phosphoribosyltransferase [Actinobacteria bacterium]|nr:decaprenyl-phosphate phosphoribosyltransferase [Actinomycetota bacterium]MCB8996964.1 decaprenyl-phosphate phosphoribosyltransferase [Actinomycetota bacterium]MCB9414045.1 decaprenyl-phosphate phosphoribosyltransferase [Actinomycetota bacterium]MCB9424554.1 decaprenyl-phosphate phosphoribosyltransferase [Actinomycetota bacterium]